MTQEIINRLKECPHCGAEADDGPLDASHAGPYIHDEDVITCGGCGIMFIGTVEQWNSRALTTLTPSGVERIRAEALKPGPCVWCKAPGQLHTSNDREISWVACPNGQCMAHGPREWSPEEAVAVWNGLVALPSEPPSQGDVELPGRLIKIGHFLTGIYEKDKARDVWEAGRLLFALASKEDGRS